MTKDRLPQQLSIGSLDSIEFQISPAMRNQFVDLVGDRSSLHVSSAFARRSMYRENVIHGMLPLLFISALTPCQIKNYKSSFREISARFLKPIFAQDRLVLNSKISEIDQRKQSISLEYSLQRQGKGTVLTTGSYNLSYNGSAANQPDKYQHQVSDSNQAMVLDPLVEQNLQFEQISKGDERSFLFAISRKHAQMLYEIITAGLSPDYQLEFSDWLSNCEVSNLLSSCLFSTFIGMCIPGKHGTFTDLRAIFHQPIEWQRRYLFTGKVTFKSQSTSTIAESIAICKQDDKTKTSAIGKINAQVNQPPVKMPSIDALKANEASLELKGKVVLITGASRGIGETAAKLFSLHGAKVAINYFRGEKDAQRIVSEILNDGGQAIAVRANVSDRQEVKQMVSTVCQIYGTIHVLVNNAVNDAYPIPFMELAWEDIQKAIDVIIKGAFNCCQEVVPVMAKNQGGKIVNMSTVFADNPPANQAKYVVSKSGLVGLTKSLAVELAPLNIQINMVVPSIVETDLSKHVSKIFLERMKMNTPMRRHATAADVAKAIVFLSSSLASFTTGQKIMVTGGNPPFL